MFICGKVLPWLAFSIKGLEQGWLAQCQFKVTGWVSYLSAAWHFSVLSQLNPELSLDESQQI